MSTTHTVNHTIGYTATTEDGPGEPIVETLTVTFDELADLLGDDTKATDLIETGSLGEHDEWMVA